MGPIIIFTTIRDIIANGVAKISLKIDRAMLLSHEPPYMLCASYVLVNMRMKTYNLISGNDYITLKDPIQKFLPHYPTYKHMCL